MLIAYVFKNPLIWVIPMIIQIVSYMRILDKMGKPRLFGIIPVLGEFVMSTDLFRRWRSFVRPAVITTALYITARYIKTDNEFGLAVLAVAFVVYAVFLARLYYRLSRQFGKKFPFALGLIFMPVIFLPILAFGKSSYLGKKEFKPEKERSAKEIRRRRRAFEAVSIAEFAILVIFCFGFATIMHPAKPIGYMMLNSIERTLADVKESDEVIGRDDTIGADYRSVVERFRTRDYFFPDHSSDKKVVVMEYIIGSNLEDDRGFASNNISQMKKATARGDGLDFVIQAGGSDRWFTRGIKNKTVGRYLISGGDLTRAEMLSNKTCMTEPENLTDFIKWTHDNYPADRYMLVMWDHGGGFSMGYGSDSLNKRRDSSNQISAAEIVSAIKDSGVKFDVIGFDACLMQNIEYANALEPYADYYLASEETEPGVGWYYTAGFGKLAENPGLSTEDFGKAMISSYDNQNRRMNGDEPQPECTLSLVDLTTVKYAYDMMAGLYSNSYSKIKDEPAVFVDMSAARTKAYQFHDKQQVDMIGYLESLKKADFDDSVADNQELEDMMLAAKTSIVYRNKDSAEGINGISIEFPYEKVDMYGSERDELKASNYESEERFFTRFCSILLSQQKSYIPYDWYEEGFENYDTTKLFIDIPVKETGGGYLAELPDKTWDIVTDCTTAAYMNVEDGQMHLGREHFGTSGSNGRSLIRIDGGWAHINGQLVCYESDSVMETDEGTVYKGIVPAKLNGTDDISIHIEWEPVKEGSDEAPNGKVTGYSRDNDIFFFMRKGLEELKPGDTLEFLFDFYDDEGNLTKTEAYGKKLRVVTQDRLKVSDEAFEQGSDVEYYGVFTDAYQRELMTEAIKAGAE